MVEMIIKLTNKSKPTGSCHFLEFGQTYGRKEVF